MKPSNPEFAELNVRVTPRSSQRKLAWRSKDELQAWVTATPTDGQANDAVQSLLSDALEVAKSRVQLVSGVTSRLKKFRIEGMTTDEAHVRLAGLRHDSE